MAYDKVIDSAQLEAAITASANAIREKTGDTALIDWIANKGFADAIAAIESGGDAKGGYFVPTEGSGYIEDAYSEEPIFIAIAEYGIALNDATHTTSRIVIAAAVTDVTKTGTGNDKGVLLYASKNSGSLAAANLPNNYIFQKTNFNMNNVSYIGCGAKTIAYTGLIPGRTYLYVVISKGGSDV